ncbi:MAG: aldolase/citrate lyase family protein [Chloroflexota bacterium]|nr:aldolase/citrate lyase family protein [Chloroflexota bacterium]
MRTNNVVTKIAAGEKPVGFTMRFPSATIVEMMGLVGFDFVMFDSEHGPFTTSDIEELARASAAAGLTPMARVPNIHNSTILRFLDRGIMGIMGPHINTKEQAQALADACRYVPDGHRSFGSGRGSHFGQNASRTRYMKHFNENVVVIAQLEDVAVLDDLDGILSVEGIDFFTSGAQDIAQSLGLPGQGEHPKVLEFEKTVRDAVRAAGRQMAADVMVGFTLDDMIFEIGVTALEAAKNQAG